MKFVRITSLALLLGATIFGVAACDACGNTGGGGVGFAGSKPCKVNGDCVGNTMQKCTVWANSPAVCDQATLHCVVKLSGGQCAEGQTHGVTMADNKPGIVNCDVTPNAQGAPKCDWTAPMPCGNQNPDGTFQQCCRGGCNAPLKCSNLSAGPGVLCMMP